MVLIDWFKNIKLIKFDLHIDVWSVYPFLCFIFRLFYCTIKICLFIDIIDRFHIFQSQHRTVSRLLRALSVGFPFFYPKKNPHQGRSAIYSSSMPPVYSWGWAHIQLLHQPSSSKDRRYYVQDKQRLAQWDSCEFSIWLELLFLFLFYLRYNMDSPCFSSYFLVNSVLH